MPEIREVLKNKLGRVPRTWEPAPRAPSGQTWDCIRITRDSNCQPSNKSFVLFCFSMRDKEGLRNYLKYRRPKKHNKMQYVTLNWVCTEGKMCYKGHQSVIWQNCSADGRPQSCAIAEFPGVANSAVDTSWSLLCYRKYPLNYFGIIGRGTCKLLSNGSEKQFVYTYIVCVCVWVCLHYSVWAQMAHEMGKKVDGCWIWVKSMQGFFKMQFLQRLNKLTIAPTKRFLQEWCSACTRNEG